MDWSSATSSLLDRTGSSESSFPVQGFSNLREVYWDPELGLLELKA
jgi:hypothetical protein